jgi:endonuclease YncB( thermonuclease family)
MHASIVFTLALSPPLIVQEKNLIKDDVIIIRSNPVVERISNSFLNHYLLVTAQDLELESKLLNRIKSIKFDEDEVVRFIDSNTIKLKSKGLVSLAGIQIPSGYNNRDKFPDCMSKSPFSKAKQYLPSGSKVMVKIVDTNNNLQPRCLIVTKSSGKLVNVELVREGFATTSNRGYDSIQKVLPEFLETVSSLQEMAKEQGLGIYKRCEQIDFPDEEQFEELDYFVETQYQDDGGRQIVRQGKSIQGIPPPDPRPTSRAQKLPICADFDTYEDALTWFERYFPFYGDVAKLDKDGDGVPCSGLPHTKDQNKYRMKKPNFKN